MTLFEKIWDRHIVLQEEHTPVVLYIDLHLIHEVTSPQAFNGLRNLKLRVRRTDRTYATVDHNVPTDDQLSIRDEISKKQIETLEQNCKEFGIPLFGLDTPYQGIVHIIGPELGLTQPGMTIVCGDSHTSTHGAFGAIAFGIGTSEVEQVLATQTLLQYKPKLMNIEVTGALKKGVTAKDVILKIIQTIGFGGGVGYAIEYSGEVIRAMNMEQRMTVCNMSIEASARCGLIAPDKTTFSYMKGRMFTPDKDFDKAVESWKLLISDDDALFDKSVTIDGSAITPMVTYGTNPSMSIGISDRIPEERDFQEDADRKLFLHALAYMDLKPGMRLEGHPVDEVFIGSCTNARLQDLRDAANLIKGKKVNANVQAIVVPGSRSVKRAAEAEGLDRIFTEAGFQWRWSGCSACLGMNPDKVQRGHYCISTSNRNFEGRQGPGARTILASPIMAAIAAVEGRITDVREYM